MKKRIKKTFNKLKNWKRNEKKKKINKKEKTIQKTIKGLVDFNNFIRDDVVDLGQRKSFNFAVHNVKQIINS